MAKKKEPLNPNEITRIEVNRFGEEEEVTYRIGSVVKRVLVKKPAPAKKTAKKEKEDE